MKMLFPGYYQPTELALKNLWRTGTFVLDTNILLNLYRYSNAVRADWFTVLQKISNRLWVPYHAILEYQRNRLGVIAEQNTLFDEVQTMVNGFNSDIGGRLKSRLRKRHTIDSTPFINKIDSACKGFITELETLKKNQPQVHDEDGVRKALEDLLENKIGPPPASQKYLDDIFAEGENRFKASMPPGYLDQTKGKSEDLSSFSSGGLYYKRKFGDLIIWKQILEFASSEKPAGGIILVTDDRKDDWWWKVDSQGDKVIGPRAELVEEMQMTASRPFYMYNSERFMEFAEANLSVKVKPESIDQIRDIAAANNDMSIERSESLPYGEPRLVRAVFDWYCRHYPGVHKAETSSSMDMVFSSSDGGMTGFDVKQFDDVIDTGHLARIISDAIRPSGIKTVFLAIVIAGHQPALLDHILRSIHASLNRPTYDFILVGQITNLGFIPSHRFDMGKIR